MTLEEQETGTLWCEGKVTPTLPSLQGGRWPLRSLSSTSFTSGQRPFPRGGSRGGLCWRTGEVVTAQRGVWLSRADLRVPELQSGSPQPLE